MRSPEESLKKIEKLLDDQVSRRERLIKDGRDVIGACSRTIIDLHNGRSDKARKELGDAEKLLGILRGAASGQLSRYLVSPETEFVEASVVYALLKNRSIPSLASLKVSPEAYILGLLDSIGELKRRVLDSLMRDEVKKARSHFAAMEALYSLIGPFAMYDHVVNGVRRKLDVARMLVEDTRGLLAEESRRERLVSKMEGLYGRLR